MNEKKNITTKETFDLAVQNHQKNNLEAAKNLYKKILEKDPNLFQSICFLGTLSIQIKNFERAIKLLNKAIGIQPNNANVNNNLGIVNNELEDFQKAKYNLARTNIRNYNH
jgi:Tfp pilus assembly protein PilF